MSVAAASGLSDAIERLRQGRQDRRPDYDRLVDPRYGLIRWVHEIPPDEDAPLGMHSFSARGSDARRIGEWPADPVGGGNGLHPERTRRAAIGEFVERYCGNYVNGDLRRGSYNDLVAAGENPVDPLELALFSERQYGAKGFPFQPFTRDLVVNWASGLSLLTGEGVPVPASLVWVNYIYGRHSGEPATNFHQFSGLAAGETLRGAIQSGISELLERDATMMWCHGDYPAPLAAADGDPLIAALTTPKRPEMKWHLAVLPSDFDVPVAGALLVDERDGIAGMGFACRATLSEAMVKAVAEAVQLRELARGINDPHRPAWRGLRGGLVHDRSLKPYREDLRYADSFRPDFRDLTDLAHHSQIYLDRRMWPALSRITGSPLRTTFSAVRPVGGDFLETALDRLAAQGMHPVCVDVTTEDVAAAGLWVVRVVIPGLLPNGPAGFPFLGGRRLYEVPARNGWRTARLTEAEVNHDPLPHS